MCSRWRQQHRQDCTLLGICRETSTPTVCASPLHILNRAISGVIAFFVSVPHRDYILTHLDNFSVTRVIDGKPARLFIWDICGSEDDDDSSLPPVPKVDVVVLCFSLASRTSCLLMPCMQATPPSVHVNANNRDCLCVMSSEERAEKMGV